MDLSFIKPQHLQHEVLVYLEALELGLKTFWLVDNLPPKLLRRFLTEIEKSKFSHAEVLDETFVWLNLIQPPVPAIYSVEDCCLRKDEILSKQFIETFNEISPKSKITTKNLHFTPSIIGFLLGYPLVYSITENFTESKNSLNNSDLILHKYSFKSIIITSFTIPAHIDIKPVSLPNCDILSEVINLPSVCMWYNHQLIQTEMDNYHNLEL